MVEPERNDELSVEELEDVAGGTGENSGVCNGNCPCSSTDEPIRPSI